MPHREKLKILFVFNPISGGQAKTQWEDAIRAYFRESEHSFEVYHTHGKGDEESVKYWINDWRPDRVAAVGGDGTIKLVASVLVGTQIPMAIFPAGSANGMAKELNIPPVFETCMDIMLQGDARKTDVICINERDICLHLSDIGLNAQLVKYFEETGMRGKLGYARGILKTLFRRRLFRIKIVTDDHRIFDRKAFMVVLANARMYGIGAFINPHGDMHDGIFEVVVVRKLSVIELVKMLFRHRPFDPEKTEVLSARSVTIQTSKRMYFQVDGEYRGKTKRIVAAVQPNAILLMHPRDNGE